MHHCVLDVSPIVGVGGNGEDNAGASHHSELTTYSSERRNFNNAAVHASGSSTSISCPRPSITAIRASGIVSRTFTCSGKGVKLLRAGARSNVGTRICNSRAVISARSTIREKPDMSQIVNLEFDQMRSQSGQKSGMLSGCLNHPRHPSLWPSSQYIWRRERSTA